MFVAICFLNDTPTTEIYTLSLHAALPIFGDRRDVHRRDRGVLRQQHRLGAAGRRRDQGRLHRLDDQQRVDRRSEEHTSELPSRQYLVCRLLLEKKNTPYDITMLSSSSSLL